MEGTPKKSEALNLDYAEGVEHAKPFYERPEEVNRNLTEVAPHPGETDKKFIERASTEFARQYPDSKKAKRARMGELTLEAERRQIMQEERAEAQQEHEASTDEEYREQLRTLHQEYQTTTEGLNDYLAKGILTSKEVQDAKHRAKFKWLNGRKAANEQYDTKYHEQADVGTPLAEDIEQFRKQETEDLNRQHEQIMNYEAERLGVDYALDSGLIARLAEGDFSKESSKADLGKTIQRGMGGEVSSEVDRFIGNLWQPEIEVIKHNAVMRAVADPVRSKNVADDSGSHDEEHFILPITNPEFTEYVAESIKEGDGALVVCAGLSKTLNYGTRDEAIERARWFYDIAHEEAGLSDDDILTVAEASNIARGNDDNRKWHERFNDFVMDTIDWGEYEHIAEQDLGHIEVKEYKMSTEELIDNLHKRIQSLNIEYQNIGNPKNNRSRNGVNRGNSNTDEITKLSREIILLNRNIQHIEGTRQVISDIRSDSDFIELGVSVQEPVYLDGAWATARCKISAIKVESPMSINEAWAFISEGTAIHEQNIYYGMTDSLESVKKLFSGDFWRVSGKTPNIKDMNVFNIRHDLMPGDLKESVEHGWSENDIEKLVYEPAYREIANYFTRIINDGSYTESAITREEMDAAEAIKSTDTQEDEDNHQADTDNMPEADSAPVEENEEQTTKKTTNEVEPPTEQVEPSIEEPNSQTEETAPQMKDKELFNLILSKQSGISNRGINALRDKNTTLNQLTRTPKGAMEQILSEQDIRKITEILDENGRDHPKWLDE